MRGELIIEVIEPWRLAEALGLDVFRTRYRIHLPAAPASRERLRRQIRAARALAKREGFTVEGL